MKHCGIKLIMAVFLVSALSSHAALITGTLTADTYIREDYPTQAWGDDSDGEILVGFLKNDKIHMMLDFSFDLSSLSLGPTENVVVNSVTLQGTTRSGTAGSGSSLAIDVYEYGFNFSRAAATWNDPTAGVADDDNTAGGTFGSTLLSQVTMNPGVTGTAITFSDTAAFRTALAANLNDDATFNLIMKGTNPTGSNLFARFQDLDNTSPFTLTADVSVVPEPATMSLIAMAGLALMLWRRKLSL